MLRVRRLHWSFSGLVNSASNHHLAAAYAADQQKPPNNYPAAIMSGTYVKIPLRLMVPATNGKSTFLSVDLLLMDRQENAS